MPHTGNIQGKGKQGSEKPGLVEDHLTNGCPSYSSFVRKTRLRGK